MNNLICQHLDYLWLSNSETFYLICVYFFGGGGCMGWELRRDLYRGGFATGEVHSSRSRLIILIINAE